MRVNDDYKIYNVLAQQKDNTSVLACWKEMLALRKREEDVLASDFRNHLEIPAQLPKTYGTFQELLPKDKSIYAYTRSAENQTLLVILNFTDKTVKCRSFLIGNEAVLLKSTYDSRTEVGVGKDEIELRAYEGRLYRL